MLVTNNVLLNWYTKEHMFTSMNHYLQNKGYKVYKEDEVFGGEGVIFAVTSGSKEMIHLKGYVPNPLKLDRGNSLLTDNIHTLTSNLESSLLILSRTCFNKILPVSICLPYISSYKKVIDRVGAVFTAANLGLKIYLVNEEGFVSTLNLNKAILPE